MPKGWIGKPSPKSMNMKKVGWFYEMDRVYVDLESKYCVMIRTIQTEWGILEHAAIRNDTSDDIPWREKQRIKNEIFGEDRFAVEVYPSVEELVDQANMYHIWVFPKGFKLPFTIFA